MKFKNELEKKSFEIAQEIFGDSTTVEHNKIIQIENALFPEVASFKGPPKKEIDVLALELNLSPKIVLLISCKLFTRRAEPAHVQEWCSVVQTMNKYTDSTLYLGLVLSPTGFTSGCEAWASAHNIGLIPPIKGKQLAFSEDTFFKMFKRTMVALKNRVRIQAEDLAHAPVFFDFVYNMVSDFEGHEEAICDKRFAIMPENWASSFAEMYAAINGHTVKGIFTIEQAGVIEFDNSSALKVTSSQVEIWKNGITQSGKITPQYCFKNIEMEPCPVEQIQMLIRGLPVTSAGDFGRYLELGIDSRFNLGIYQNGFHVFSTEMPMSKHKL